MKILFKILIASVFIVMAIGSGEPKVNYLDYSNTTFSKMIEKGGINSVLTIEQKISKDSKKNWKGGVTKRFNTYTVKIAFKPDGTFVYSNSHPYYDKPLGGKWNIDTEGYISKGCAGDKSCIINLEFSNGVEKNAILTNIRTTGIYEFSIMHKCSEIRGMNEYDVVSKGNLYIPFDVFSFI